jgi:DNA polymerase-3 subunit beta
VFPSDSATTATVDRDDLAAAVSRVALVKDDKERKIRLSFANTAQTISGDEVTADGVEEMPCSLKGGACDVGFNSRYLKDTLAALDVDAVDVGMNDPRSVVLFRSPARRGVTLALMPIRI